MYTELIVVKNHDMIVFFIVNLCIYKILRINWENDYLNILNLNWFTSLVWLEHYTSSAIMLN